MEHSIYLARHGRHFGPYSVDEIHRQAAAGQLAAKDLFWMTGWPSWKPFDELPLPVSNGGPLSSTTICPTTAAGTEIFRKEALQRAEQDQLTRCLLGRNADYYIRRWRSEEETGRRTWNAGAFFFGFSWLAYRKMYRHSFVASGVVAAVAFLAVLLRLPNGLPQTVGIGIGVICGASGNRWYGVHIRKKLKEVTLHEVSKATITFRIDHEGGTNFVGACGIALGIVLLIGALLLLKF